MPSYFLLHRRKTSFQESAQDSLIHLIIAGVDFCCAIWLHGFYFYYLIHKKQKIKQESGNSELKPPNLAYSGDWLEFENVSFTFRHRMFFFVATSDSEAQYFKIV